MAYKNVFSPPHSFSLSCSKPIKNFNFVLEIGPSVEDLSSDIRDVKQRGPLGERCLKIFFPVIVIILRLLPVDRNGKCVSTHIPRIKLVRMVWILKEKLENLSSGACVLHMTSNLNISRRCQDENGKEINQNAKRTCRACRAIVFAN